MSSSPFSLLAGALVLGSLLGAPSAAFALQDCQTVCSCTTTPCGFKCSSPGVPINSCGHYSGYCINGSSCRTANPDTFRLADTKCEPQSVAVAEAPKPRVEPAPAVARPPTSPRDQVPTL
jgi:hypothetical protein